MFKGFGIHTRFAVAATLSLFFSHPPKAAAQGNLIIIPRRVVFEGNKRTQELNLANTGTDTAKYLISVIQYRMKEDGNFEIIERPDSGQLFADQHFRFFPRSVTLAPNEAQTIKVQIINAGQLEAGEYRSHLYFRAVPNDKPLGEKDEGKDGKSISVRIVPVFGISIPVIIRTGSSTMSATISNAAIELIDKAPPKLKLDFTRSGNMSVYGDIKVDHISPQGKITPVGIAKGFAIYTPINNRYFAFDLDKTAPVNFHKGKLHIEYAAQTDSKPVRFAEKEIELH